MNFKKNVLRPFSCKNFKAANIPIIVNDINKGTTIIRSIAIRIYVDNQMTQEQNALYILSFVKNGSSLNYHQLT